MFNGAQLHMLFNHVPVITILWGVAFTLVGIFRNNPDYKKWGMMFVFFAGVTALPAYFTGERAEDTIRGTPTFSKEFIHEHEDAAEATTIVVVIAALLSVSSLYLKSSKPDLSKWLERAMIVAALMGLVAMGRTAHLGGVIGHPEVRSGFIPKAVMDSSPGPYESR